MRIHPRGHNVPEKFSLLVQVGVLVAEKAPARLYRMKATGETGVAGYVYQLAPVEAVNRKVKVSGAACAHHLRKVAFVLNTLILERNRYIC